MAAILKDSHLFKHVKTGFDTGDLKLHIFIVDTYDTNILWKLICGLSYLIIPSYEKRDVSIKYQFKDNNDILLKEYTRRVIFHDWIHLFLFPVMPFKSPLIAHDRGIEKVTKSVLAEAIRDGVFK